MRVKIFIDFWNFQLSWNEYHKKIGETGIVRIPWKIELPKVLTNLLGKDAEYAGTHVYASVNKMDTRDAKFIRFLDVMKGFPGYNVTIKNRRPGDPLKCTNKDCYKKIDKCPHCKKKIVRTVEKGIDTAIIIDMIQLAIDDRYDRAILIAADRDFIGAIKFIQDRMKRVSHVWFSNKANNLQAACWDHFLFEDIMGQLLQSNESGD